MKTFYTHSKILISGAIVILLSLSIGGIWKYYSLQDFSDKNLPSEKTTQTGGDISQKENTKKYNLSTDLIALLNEEKSDLFLENGEPTSYLREKINNMLQIGEKYTIETPWKTIELFAIDQRLSNFRPLTIALDKIDYFSISPDSQTLERFIYTKVLSTWFEPEKFSASWTAILPLNNEAMLSIITRNLIRKWYSDALGRIWPLIKNRPIKNNKFAIDRLVIESYYNQNNNIQLEKEEKERKFLSSLARLFLYESDVLGEKKFAEIYKKNWDIYQYSLDVSKWLASFDTFNSKTINAKIQEWDNLIKRYQALPKNFVYSGRSPFFMNAMLEVFKNTPESIKKAKEYLEQWNTIVNTRYNKDDPTGQGIPIPLWENQKMPHVNFLLGIVYLSEGKFLEARNAFKTERDSSPFDNIVYFYHNYTLKKIKWVNPNITLWTPVP